MSTRARRPGPYTIADWQAQPDERRVELHVAVLFGDDPE